MKENTVEIGITYIPKYLDKTVLPSYSFSGDSGMDVRADLPMKTNKDSYILRFGEQEIIPTGIFLDIPEGYEIQVRPRSGLAFKYGVTVTNSPGTIDSGFQGEVKLIISKVAVGEEDKERAKRLNDAIQDLDPKLLGFHFMPGDKLAQIVLCKVPKIKWVPILTNQDSDRKDGGFGSTGL